MKMTASVSGKRRGSKSGDDLPVEVQVAVENGSIEFTCPGVERGSSATFTVDRNEFESAVATLKRALGIDDGARQAAPKPMGQRRSRPAAPTEGDDK